MNKKLIAIGIILTLIFLYITPVASAFEKASGASAVLATATAPENDTRVKILQGFLESYKSPLVGSAQTFVKTADQYNLDWRLVASISGVESTFAHRLPYQSYNAWGWGIYGDNMIYFKSYDDGITIISKSLRERYINKWGAQDVYQIGRFYAASPTWAQKVEYFMNRIELYAIQNQVDTLSISL